MAHLVLAKGSSENKTLVLEFLAEAVNVQLEKFSGEVAEWLKARPC
jgi:hypothetical protein